MQSLSRVPQPGQKLHCFSLSWGPTTGWTLLSSIPAQTILGRLRKSDPPEVVTYPLVPFLEEGNHHPRGQSRGTLPKFYPILQRYVSWNSSEHPEAYKLESSLIHPGDLPPWSCLTTSVILPPVLGGSSPLSPDSGYADLGGPWPVALNMTLNAFRNVRFSIFPNLFGLSCFHIQTCLTSFLLSS